MSSNVAFVLVLADALVAAWRDVVGTIGSLVLPAALLFAVTAMATISRSLALPVALP